MPTANYRIRTMTKEDLQTAIDWAAAEGWNPGLQDAESFYACDPSGFFIGEIDGEPIAMLSAVKYGASFGFMGFYIVKPEYRGQGYGMQVWNTGLDYLSGRNIGLDGVVEQQQNYKKSGFTLAYRNIRFEGVNKPAPTGNTNGVVELSSRAMEQIQAYDRAFFPDERSAFLTRWLQQPGHHALGVIVDNTLAGYGVIRPCRTGYKIGPLFADTPSLAESLFCALTNQVEPSAPIYFDVPEINQSAVALANRQQMKPVFETARMYTQGAPELPMDKLFGVTSFELG